MTLSQLQSSINQVDKDIANLENKLATLLRAEADKNKRINSIERSISKNTSASMLSSKLKQISSLQNEIAKIISQRADINKKIAEKRKKHNDLSIKIQKEQNKISQNDIKERKQLEQAYQKQITDLTQQFNNRLSQLQSSSNISPYSTLSNEKYDVFISHASEDKEDFVNEFASILDKSGLKVWYDTDTIQWGDSIRTRIDQGLKNCRFGIVVLSRSYLAKYWTQYELEGLFQRESVDGKLILPIWHNITKKEVQAYSPVLAGKMALNTALMTPEEIKDELLNLINAVK